MIDSVSLETIQKQKRITAVMIGKSTGLNPKSLSTIKRRESCRLVTARMIARALGVSVEELQKKED